MAPRARSWIGNATTGQLMEGIAEPIVLDASHTLAARFAHDHDEVIVEAAVDGFELEERPCGDAWVWGWCRGDDRRWPCYLEERTPGGRLDARPVEPRTRVRVSAPTRQLAALFRPIRRPSRDGSRVRDAPVVQVARPNRQLTN